MINKNRGESLNRRYRMLSNPLIRPPQRLVFPIKQFQQGFVGKKQFLQKNHDNVILQSPDHPKFVRRDILDISDIKGAKPKLIQVLNNVHNNQSNNFKKSQSQKTFKERRSKTEIGDSLDNLIRGKALQKQLKSMKSTKYIQKTQEIQKHLLKRNLQFTKQHILGIYPRTQHEKNPQKPIYLSPTYLSSLHNPLY